MTKQALHQPVLLTQVITWLNPQPNQWYLDATFGRGGHTKALLDQQAKIIAFDSDLDAINYGQEKFAEAISNNHLILIHDNFDHLKKIIEHQQLDQKICGILFDFGTSMDQIKIAHRGFSFNEPEAELDMRMDENLGVTAADLLNILSVKQMTTLFQEYGGEEQAKKIAAAINYYRGKNKENKIETVGQLVEIINQVKTRRSHLHPATKVFQALRIAVNDELNSIKQSLPQALSVLKPTGRIITIAFHEGEDRIVKHQFKNWATNKQGKILTDKPIKPNDLEISQNPSARSAKLRVFEK